MITMQHRRRPLPCLVSPVAPIDAEHNLSNPAAILVWQFGYQQILRANGWKY